jgi:hypothetical protein
MAVPSSCSRDQPALSLGSVKVAARWGTTDIMTAVVGRGPRVWRSIKCSEYVALRN